MNNINIQQLVENPEIYGNKLSLKDLNSGKESSLSLEKIIKKLNV